MDSVDSFYQLFMMSARLQTLNAPVGSEETSTTHFTALYLVKKILPLNGLCIGIEQ